MVNYVIHDFADNICININTSAYEDCYTSLTSTTKIN